VVLDIEGTTTPISFVADELFRYIRRELPKYLQENWGAEQLTDDITQLRTLASDDKKDNVEGLVDILDETNSKEDVITSVIKNVNWQMDKDRKSTALKNLQGHMWKAGYSRGELKAALFDDVPEAFKRWATANIPIYIYSSGSIEAQKLLFGHTNAGDLLPFISGHFDTTTGPKVEAPSYTKIVESIGVPHRNVLFVTDAYLEAVAANKAGLGVVLTDRPGNKPLPEDNQFTVVKSFSNLFSLYEFAQRSS